MKRITYSSGPQGDYPHLHTVIVLHGKGNTDAAFVNRFFDMSLAPDSSSTQTPVGFDERFPYIRWVFPMAPLADPAKGRDARRWFFMMSHSEPHISSQLQQPDLQNSIDHVLAAIDREAKLVPRKNIFLCGFDQGMALALATFIVDGTGDFSGVIGLSG